MQGKMLEVDAPKEAKKWYNSRFANYIGKGASIALIILAFAKGCDIYDNNPEKIKYYIQKQKTLEQKYTTIETLVEKYGDEMSPKEFDQYLKSLLEKEDIDYLSEPD